MMQNLSVSIDKLSFDTTSAGCGPLKELYSFHCNRIVENNKQCYCAKYIYFVTFRIEIMTIVWWRRVWESGKDACYCRSIAVYVFFRQEFNNEYHKETNFYSTFIHRTGFFSQNLLTLWNKLPMILIEVCLKIFEIVSRIA